MDSATLLRTSRHAAGITQRVLAERTRVAQGDISDIENGRRQPRTNLLARLLSASGHALVSIPAQGTTTVGASRQIHEALAGSRPDDAIRGFIGLSDNLRRNHGIDRLTVGLAEPSPTGSPEWDAALAGVVEFWFNNEKLPLPHWVNGDRRYLETPATPHLTRFDAYPDIDSVPDEFRRRNVLVEKSTLESV